MTSAEFESAFAEAKNLNTTIPNDALLKIYAYAKIAKEQPLPDSRPGMFNMKERAKYDAWKAELDAGVTAKQAEQKYIDLVAELKEKHGLKA